MECVVNTINIIQRGRQVSEYYTALVLRQDAVTHTDKGGW